MKRIHIPGGLINPIKGVLLSMMTGIYGEKHEAHSAMLDNGVMGVTLKGRRSPRSTELEQENKLKGLFNVVDGAMRT